MMNQTLIGIISYDLIILVWGKRWSNAMETILFWDGKAKIAILCNVFIIRAMLQQKPFYHYVSVCWHQVGKSYFSSNNKIFRAVRVYDCKISSTGIDKTSIQPKCMLGMFPNITPPFTVSSDPFLISVSRIIHLVCKWKQDICLGRQASSGMML